MAKTRLASRVHSASELEEASSHLMKVKQEAEAEEELQRKIKASNMCRSLCDLRSLAEVNFMIFRFFHFVLRS